MAGEAEVFGLDEERNRRLALVADLAREASTRGGGGGTYDGMERIAKLEARADIVEKRLDRIDDKLDRVLERLGSMPTTNGLWGMIATVIGVALTMIGIVVAVIALA